MDDCTTGHTVLLVSYFSMQSFRNYNTTTISLPNLFTGEKSSTHVMSATTELLLHLEFLLLELDATLLSNWLSDPRMRHN